MAKAKRHLPFGLQLGVPACGQIQRGRQSGTVRPGLAMDQQRLGQAADQS